MNIDYIPIYTTMYNTMKELQEEIPKELIEEAIIVNKHNLETLEKSHVFCLDKNIVSAISNSIAEVNLDLPFSEILLIPEDLTIDNCKVDAIMFEVRFYDEQEKIIYKHIPGTPEIKTSAGIKYVVAHYLIRDYSEGRHIRVTYLPKDINRMVVINKTLVKPNYHFDKTIQNFIYGFINFLNNPEVSFIETNFNKTQNIKRISKGKLPLPTRTIIQINGELKRYLYNYETQNKNNPYSHKFWVRGHFRHFNSDKYKLKKGQVKWILPFTKGKGILINKTYEVVQ